MKVLQVNCVYKKGSTGKITYDLHKGLLDAGIESVVCYGRGELVNEPNVYKTCPEWYSKLNNAWSRITGIMYGGCFFSTNRLISIIKKEKPDVVHLQCINGYFVNIYRLINWLKKSHIKTVLTLHAEFMYTGGCGHSIDCKQWQNGEGCRKCPQYREETKSLIFDRTRTMWSCMKKSFDGFNDGLIVTSVSPWLMKRAKQSQILGDKNHCVVLNGLDTSVFHCYSETETRALRESLGISSDRKVVFHATPAFNLDPNHLKGGYYVARIAESMPTVQFVIAGAYSKDIQVPKNIKLLGKVQDQIQLAKLYAMADVTVLTSRRETFSMVTAESLCCGTPVVGFKAGGPEQIAIQKYSAFVEYGNLECLQRELQAFLGRPKEKIVNAAVDKYSNSKAILNYIACYKELVMQ